MSGLNSVYNNVTFALKLHSNAMFALQEQAATGSRINRASDDPSSAYRVLGLNSQQRYQANFIDNINRAIDTQTLASEILLKISPIIIELKSNLTGILNGINGQSGRDMLADQIDDILEQMVSFANTKNVNEYIFGGENTTSAPYVVRRNDSGEITSITYQGSIDGRNIEIASGVESDITFAGNDIFRSDDRQDPVFYGSTGAAAGTGTSNVRGDLWLTVRHDGTNYILSIDGGTTEVTVPSSGDISNIAVTNANGEVFYVDATNITETGTERVRIPGTYDIFNILMSTRDLLRNPNGISEDTLGNLVAEAATSLEQIRTGIVEKDSSIGTKINFLESLKDNIENLKINGEDEVAMLQDADIAQIAIDLSRRQTLYEMSLSVAGKLMSMSLLDFLR